jgi:hypothetical protein
VGCFYITSSAIIAQNSIVSDTHQSRRQDMQAEAPDELQGGNNHTLFAQAFGRVFGDLWPAASLF